MLSVMPSRWLVTGVAGFIGSHLLEALLELDREVVGLDNFVTGRPENLDEVRRHVSAERWSRFDFVEGDVRSRETCQRAVEAVDVVCHQAGLNSVPRSMDAPAEVTEVNVTGTVNVLHAAVAAGVERFVYASSSSVYGDATGATRIEGRTGHPLSPYAASKRAAEGYAAAYHRSSGIAVVGLRYFNVFGPRQVRDGPYSAVIPRWIGRLLDGIEPDLYGDGSQVRDFTFVDNVVAANLLAARVEADELVVNVGTGRALSLRALFELIRAEVAVATGRPELLDVPVRELPARAGDAASSVASVRRARAQLSYRPSVDAQAGMRRMVEACLAERRAAASVVL